MANESSWYILGNNQETLGPYTSEQIIERLHARDLPGETLCCAEGMTEWLPLAELEPFASTIRELAATAADRVPAAVVPGPVEATTDPGRESVEAVPRAHARRLALSLALAVGAVALGALFFAIPRKSAETAPLLVQSDSTLAPVAGPDGQPPAGPTRTDPVVAPEPSDVNASPPAEAVPQPATPPATPTQRRRQRGAGGLEDPSQIPPEEMAQLFVIRKNGRYGYMDRLGKVVIEPQFGEARDFHDGLACVCPYTDPDPAQEKTQGEVGKELTEADLDRMYGAGSDRPVPGPPERQYGYIDRTGKIVIPARFKVATDFSEGSALVLPTVEVDRWAMKWDEYREMSEAEKAEWRASQYKDLAQVMPIPARISFPPASYYLMDTNGNKIVEGIVTPFSEALAARTHFVLIEMREEWRPQYVEFIDPLGKLVHRTQSWRVGRSSEGLVRFDLKNRISWGYMDRLGKVVIQPRFLDAREFHDGLAAVKTVTKHPLTGEGPNPKNTWVYIDRTGAVAIAPEIRADAAAGQYREETFEEAGDFFEGFAVVRIHRTAGPLVQGKPALKKLEEERALIDKTGRRVFVVARNPAPDTGRFSGGLIAVRGGEGSGPWDYCDQTGKRVTNQRYDEAGDYRGGLARVSRNGSWAYINRRGRPVWVENPDLFGQQ